MRIILSRTDSIGDVVLTLPMAAALKREIPGCTVSFLGREYTRPVIEACTNVDEFLSWGEPFPVLRADVIIHVFPVPEVCRMAKKAGIPLRIATSGRLYTWFSCNKLLRIPRKNSNLHEAQLNLRLLHGLGLREHYSPEEISGMYGLNLLHDPGEASPVSKNRRIRVILHPKSKGSAREWGLDNFSGLIRLLPPEKFEIVITGTREEGGMMSEFLDQHRRRVTDMTGKLNLHELMKFIAGSDILVAASTGPLHLAAALGIRAIGLYAPMRPIFPGRWAPIGPGASFLVLDKECNDCRKSGDCACIRSISPEQVADEIRRTSTGSSGH